MEASITFKAVGKAIGKQTLLADLSFGVEKGSTFVLLGENGSGKSMVLKLLVGLVEKNSGAFYIKGQDIVKGLVMGSMLLVFILDSFFN